MKIRNPGIAAIAVLVVAIALVWGGTALSPAGKSGGPAGPVAVASSGAAGSPGNAGGAAAQPNSEGPSTASNQSAADAAGTPGATTDGAAILTATSTAPAGFTIRIPVFMYHRVAPDNQIGSALPGLVVDPRRFAAQMDALQRAGWHTITARTLAYDLAAGRRPPRHSFVITFDDGHEDGYTYAYPILRRHGFVATYFVITDRIGHGGYLSRPELRTMAGAGMEIASHTMRHADVTQLSSSSLRAQLVGSAQAIAGVIGTRPVTFAYPYGKWDRSLARPLASAGYGMAFIEGGTCAYVSWPSRFWVPRLRVDRTMSAGGPLARARACAG